MADKQSQLAEVREATLSDLNSVSLPAKESDSLEASLHLSSTSSVSLDNTERLRSKLELMAEVSPATNRDDTKAEHFKKTLNTPQARVMPEAKASILFRVIDFLAKFIKKWEDRLLAALSQEPSTEKVIIAPEEEEEELEDEERYARLKTRLKSSDKSLK